MSAASSVLSSRPPSSGWRINVRLAALMDSISAIAFGLGLRFLIDTVGRYDFKLTGTLVGLWEGVIMLHFLKKMPRSSDPYIGFGVRLFIDFLFTESVARLVLVLIWTALGMVLADITPALWDEVGLQRTWRHVRRDLYTLSKMVPTVAFFPPPRTVRFSPSREPSLITEEAPTDADAHTNEPTSSVVEEPSIITTEETPVDAAPSTRTPAAREILKRRLPGHFPSGYSDADTEIGSPRGDTGRTSRRLSMYPVELDTASDFSSSNDANEEEDDIDDANRSVSDTTERGEPTSTSALNLEEVPEMVTEDPLLVDTSLPPKPVDQEEGDRTPKQTAHNFYMPPTPSDSAARVQRNRRILEDPNDKESIPASEQLPQIPDFLEEPGSEGWEKIGKEDLDPEGKPPTPPAKDGLPVSAPTVLPVPPPRAEPTQNQIPSPLDGDDDNDMKGWDTLDSQFISGPSTSGQHTTNDNTQPQSQSQVHRQSQPPPYEQTYNDVDYDDIYEDPPPSSYAYAPDPKTLDSTNLFGGEGDGIGGTGLDNPWQPDAEAEAARLREEEEKERQRKAEEEAEAARIKAAEEEKKKREEEEEEALKKKKAEEKAERMKKEADDAAARKKKREEEEAAEQARKKAEAEAAAAAAKAEEQRLKEEEAEKKKKKKEEELAERKRIAEEAEARRKEAKKKEEEEQRKKKEEEEQRKKKKEEEEERIKKEEADRQKAEAEAAERLKREEEARQKAQAEADAAEAARQQKATEEAEAEAQRKQFEEDEKAAQERERAKAPTPPPKDFKNEKGDQEPASQQSPDAPSASDSAPQSAELENQDLDVDEGQSPTGDEPQENDPPAPPKAETVLSSASDPDPNVKERLAKMLTLRAQMVEVEARLDKLRADGADESSPEVVQTERILRKYERQAAKRYEQGTPLARYPGFDETDDEILLETSNSQMSERKIEERLEQLLTPSSRSLHFTVLVGKKQNDAKKQKAALVQLLNEYGLFSYSSENNMNKKLTTVDVPEEKFATWLAHYRVLSTQAKPQEEGTTSVLWQ